jgi:hypothetical protein
MPWLLEPWPMSLNDLYFFRETKARDKRHCKKSLDGAARKLKPHECVPSLCGDAPQSLSLVSLMFAPPLLHMERKGEMNLGFGEIAATRFYCVQVFSQTLDMSQWSRLHGV